MTQSTDTQPDVYVYAEQKVQKDEAQDMLNQQAEQSNQNPTQDVAAKESSTEFDDKDPKQLLAKANELFQRASHRVSSQNAALEKEARALVEKALEIDPKALDHPEVEEPKQETQQPTEQPTEQKTEETTQQRERLTVPVENLGG